MQIDMKTLSALSWVSYLLDSNSMKAGFHRMHGCVSSYANYVQTAAGIMEDLVKHIMVFFFVEAAGVAL